MKSASESDYTVLDRDGRIRRLYRVVKDIQDDSGNPVFSEGALYEISPKPDPASGSDTPDRSGESDQTELICRFRPNGTLTYVNEAYCRYFGCEREELQNRNILLSISEADREKVYSRLKDLRPERPVDTLEYRVENVFGDVLWNQWTYRALFDDSGNILEYQSVGRDITFRKYTQDVLEKRAAILEAVTYAAEGFLKSASWRDRIERVLERFGAAMNAAHVFLCENQIGEDGEIAVRHSYEWRSPKIHGAGDRRQFLRDSELAVRFSRWVYGKSEGRPIYGTIGQFPDGEVGELALDKKLSIAVVPILTGERWWGFIGFADYSGDIQWTEDEIAPLGAASEILGAAVEREEKEKALGEAHANLLDQERFLAGVFDAIQDGIMVATPDMTILRVNQTVEKRFPHIETLAGRKCYEAYYGRKDPCENCQSLMTVKTGKAASGVQAIVGPDGACKGWVEVFSYPWVDPGTGRLKGVIEYSRDITEKKRAEEARRRSEERLQTFLDSFRDPVFLKDNDRRYLFVNEAGFALLGRTREETIGKTDSEMFNAADDAEREKEKTDLTLLQQAVGPLRFEQRIRDRILETTKFRVNLEDGRVGIGGILRDVTDQRQAAEKIRRSEELLRTFVDSSRDYIFLKDEKGRNILLNRAVRKYTGRTEEEILGKTDTELLPPAVAERSRQSDRKVLETGKAFTSHERDQGQTFEVMKFPVHFSEDCVGVGGIIRDITERIRAEEALRASEERYRELADTIPVGVYEADGSGNIVYANKTAWEMFGFEAEELASSGGINFLRIVTPEEHATALANARRVREEKALVVQEYTFTRKDGGRFTGLVTSRPIVADGRVTGSRGVCTDISALKETQGALRENEAMLRSILQAAPIGISFGEGRTLKWVNERYQRMTGYGREQLEGNSTRVLYDSDKEFLRVGADFFRGIERDGIGTTDARWTRKDGSTIDVLLSMSAIFPEDPAKGVVVTALDVTEQKKAEEALRASESRYRELADNMPAGIYEATLDGRVVYANRTALDMFGFSADEVEKGVRFAEVVAPESLDDLARNVPRIREGTAFGFEYAMLRKNGSRFFGLNMARPIIKDGRVAGSTGIITDVTELRTVQEALRKNEALLGSILQAAPIGVGMVHDRTLEWVNEGVTALTGYDADELKGKSARILYSDQEEFERVGREKQAEMETRGKGAVETRWRRKDGAVIDIHLSSAPIDPGNRAAGVVFTALDITAQKKAARILLFAKKDLEKQVAEQTRELDVANMLLRIELEEHRKTALPLFRKGPGRTPRVALPAVDPARRPEETLGRLRRPGPGSPGLSPGVPHRDARRHASLAALDEPRHLRRGREPRRAPGRLPGHHGAHPVGAADPGEPQHAPVGVRRHLGPAGHGPGGHDGGHAQPGGPAVPRRLAVPGADRHLLPGDLPGTVRRGGNEPRPGRHRRAGAGPSRAGHEGGIRPVRGGVRLPRAGRRRGAAHGHHPGHRPDAAAADGAGADPERKTCFPGAPDLRDRSRDQQPEQLHQLQHADPARLHPGYPARPRRARLPDAPLRGPGHAVHGIPGRRDEAAREHRAWLHADQRHRGQAQGILAQERREGGPADPAHRSRGEGRRHLPHADPQDREDLRRAGAARHARNGHRSRRHRADPHQPADQCRPGGGQARLPDPAYGAAGYGGGRAGRGSRRQRLRDGRQNGVPHLRPLLHDEGGGAGHGPGALHLEKPDRVRQGVHHRGERNGPGHDLPRRAARPERSGSPGTIIRVKGS
ncbi:MAG: PAS domain S-box protein [Syntrophales bacterium]|nr:PAS domain S-box protein [Syntrophales bacterium]